MTGVIGVTGVIGATGTEAMLADRLEALAGFRDGAERADQWGRELAVRMTGGARLLVAGNGGSAAEAAHLAAELVGRYKRDRAPFSALALSAEGAALTALVNDYPPEELFARQVQAHGRAGDVLVLLSTSGRSPNVVRAAEEGRRLGLTTWAMTGAGPNPLAESVEDCITVADRRTAIVQELHMVSTHILCAAFDEVLLGPDPAVA